VTDEKRTAKILPFRRVIVVPRLNDKQDRINDLLRALDRTRVELAHYRTQFNRADIADRERLRKAIENTEFSIDQINERIQEEQRK